MENSIEEDIAKVNTYIELVLEKDYCNCNELNTILGKHCDGSKNVAYAMQHILSDYKRVLKELDKQQTTINKYTKEIEKAVTKCNELENEKKELKKENEILENENAKALEEWNNLEQGSYKTEQRLKSENEKLKALDLRNSKIIANMSTRHFQDREKIRNSIPIQKVKDKIEEYKKDGIIKNQTMPYVGEYIKHFEIKALQELIEEREEKTE